MTISPIYFEDFQETPEAYLARWVDNRNKPTETEGSDWYKVFLNGAPFVDVTDDQAVLSGLQAGKYYNVDVRLVSGVDRSRWAAWPFYVEPSLGSRLKISIPTASIVTNPDFFSYVLYWDEGAGTPADTLLKELVGINSTEFITDELTDGTTYLFRVALKDAFGNEGTPGSEYSGTVETLPEAPDGAAVSYASRIATITADKPDPQDSDCVGYALYSNYLPGWGLQPHLVLQRQLRLAFFPTAATLTHDTYELHPGNWKFAYRAIDSNGFESDFETVSLNVGADYLAAAAVPDRPYLIQAETIDAGKLSVEITLSNTTNATHVHIYLDDVYNGEVAVASGTLGYTYETGALVHDQTYEITARVANSAVESEDSNRVEATADDTAPTGSTVLTLEKTGDA